MKLLHKPQQIIFLICLTFVLGCGNGNKSKDINEVTDEKPVQDPIPVDNQGSNHTYDIIINAGSAKEQHLKGEIKNTAKDDGTGNNFSVYSNTPNGKGIILRIGNEDIVINGLFARNNNGTCADLSADSDDSSSLILTIKPPSKEIFNSISGTVNLSDISYALENEAGGAIAYTLDFDGDFENIEGKSFHIKGTVVVRIPNNLL